MAIQDYLDKFPGQYEGEQQRYARGMDDYYRKVDAISLREYGKHYEELDVHAQKRVESLVDMQGSARKGSIYQLEDGRIVNEQEAKDYQNKYVDMMDQAWEEHKKNRKGNPINNIDPKIGQSVVGKNVSNLVTSRLNNNKVSSPTNSLKGSRKGDRDIVQEIMNIYQSDNIDGDRVTELINKLSKDQKEDLVTRLAVGYGTKEYNRLMGIDDGHNWL